MTNMFRKCDPAEMQEISTITVTCGINGARMSRFRFPSHNVVFNYIAIRDNDYRET